MGFYWNNGKESGNYALHRGLYRNSGGFGFKAEAFRVKSLGLQGLRFLWVRVWVFGLRVPNANPLFLNPNPKPRSLHPKPMLDSFRGKKRLLHSCIDARKTHTPNKW